MLGATFETSWKVEAAAVLGVGGQVDFGAYHLTLDSVDNVDGPNYLAERGSMTIMGPGGVAACKPKPERRFFPAGGQTTSEVGICAKGLDHLYVVLGERRATPEGQPAWLVRAYVNPWVRLIFMGPFLMALGGAVSLSDRRLRVAAPGKRK